MVKMKYTFDNLLNDIQDMPDENDRDGVLGDTVGREFQSKLIVLQMLIDLASKYKAKTYDEENMLCKALECVVYGDELLSGYAFFLPQNPQFDYTWSYMRKREKSYIEFLAKAVIFLKNLLVDINILASKSRGLEAVHFVFNDIFDVSLVAETPHVKTGLRWENFYRIVATKENYNVAAMKEEAVLEVRNRKSYSDVVGIIDTVFQMLHDKEIDS